jgi:hypothetical protein
MVPSPIPALAPNLTVAVWGQKSDKDQGFNYASFDAGAKLLNSSIESEGDSNILSKDDDKYMKVGQLTTQIQLPLF